MATPSSPFDAINRADEQDALHSITRMMVGTKALQSQPGVVYALQANQARPQDAQAVDQFLQGLDAEKKFRIAQASGQKMLFSPQEKVQLKALGLDYTPYEHTQQDAAKVQAAQISAASAGTMQAKTDANGNYLLDKNGNVIQEAVPQPQEHHDTGYGTGFLGLGPLWHDLNNDVAHPIERDVINPATTVLSKGYNLVSSAFADSRSQATAGLDSGTSLLQHLESNEQNMKAAGYDPSSIWSSLAYASSGKAQTNTQDLAANWDQLHPQGLYGLTGDMAVTEADKYLNDPKGYRQAIETNPAYFTQQGTQTVMTAAGKQALDRLSSPEFGKLITQIAARNANLGDVSANAVGLDPVNHPTYYALFSAATNIAASFAVDPLMALGGITKAAKFHQIGIGSLTDARSAASVLDPINSKGFFARSVQRGWQRAIDLADQIREAHAAGNEVAERAAVARFHAELPGLAPMMDDFIGTHMMRPFEDWKTVVRDGKPRVEPTFMVGDGIRNLAEAGAYVESRGGLVRLMQGRAAVQSNLMPGMLSAFGYRKLKGLTAGWMTARSSERQIAAEGEFLNKALVDPAFAEKHITEGDLVRMQASSDNAVRVVDGTVIADKTLENLAHKSGVTLDALNKQLADVEKYGKGDTEQAATIRANLADLEDQLQKLMSDKKAYNAADPGHLAALHDQITEAHTLLDMAEKNAATSKATADRIVQQGSDLMDSMNTETKLSGSKSIENPQGEPSSNSEWWNGADDGALMLTYAGKGNIARNLRRTGNALGDHAISGWASPTAIAARARLAAQRWSTLLPRNTMFNIDDPQTADKIYKYALTYLNRGDANALRAAFLQGDGGQRAAVIEGMFDQVWHAAGLGVSESGQTLIKAAHTRLDKQAYSSVGDEIELDGVPLALHAGQVRQTWVMPDFRALQKASAKIGLWETTFGRALTSDQADFLMSQWKLGALFKPNTVTRNQLEGWGLTALTGSFGDAIKARAVLTMPNRELWKFGFSKETKVEYDRLMADGETKAAKEIANGTMLSGKFLGRSAVGKRIAEFAPLAMAGHAYRVLFGRHMNADEVEAILRLGKDELARVLEEYGQQIREGDLGTRSLARQSGETAEAGFGPSRLSEIWAQNNRKRNKSIETTEWTQQDTDGLDGAIRYEGALRRRIDATPSVARAVITHLKAEADGQTPDIQGIVDALDDPAIREQMRQTSWGKLTWDNPDGTGGAREATNDAEVALGKEIFAKKVLADYKYLFTGHNEKLQNELMDEIARTGKAPTSDWINKNLKGDNRPLGVYSPKTMTMVNGGVRKVAETLQDVQGAAYEWLVERPLLRTTSSPVFAAHFARARVGMDPLVDQLVAKGFEREAAENMADELAIKSSWVKTESLIDDPGQKTQFDVIARNMFPFSRATQAMLRRWGTALWQDPVRARKMMLAYEGGVQSGLIYNNAYGEPTFTYPASGALNMVMRELAKVPGLENLNQFPLSSSMTGGVLMAVPGADNPFRMSMGPMLSIPLREMEGLLPGHKAMFDEIDAALNGPVGVGETWAQAVPTAVRKFYTALDTDARNSAMASAMVGAIANLGAAGLLPDADATSADREKFFARLKAQVRNQLFLRAVFGLLAPAAPTSPSEGTAGSQSDYTFHMQGIGQLADEYRTILNDVQGDTARANAIWTAMHPDELVYNANGSLSGKSKIYSGYEVTHSQSVTSKAYLPSTNAALNWLDSNRDFVSTYQNVAAYFIPQSAAKGDFNDQAYQTQLEMGLRQKKTPEEFYRDVRLRHAEAVFFPAVQGFDDRIAAAKQQGNSQLASQWTKAKSIWEQSFKARNPYFADKIDNYSASRAVARDQLSNLEEMVAKGQVPGGNAHLLNELIVNYKNLEGFLKDYNGGTAADTATKQAARAMFNDWVTKNITGSELADLYNGVFRTLDTNLVNIAPTTGG